MDVILLEKVANLGDLGDKVSVKPGFARNYLVPQGKAKPATAENLAEFEAKRAEFEKLENQRLEEAKARAAELESVVVSIQHAAGEEGKLFGSVTAHEIAEAVSAAVTTIEKSEIRMPDGPIKELGEHVVQVAFHSDVIVDLNLNVEAE